MAALAMAEYACGATGHNPRLKPCINPLHPQAAVGGSSSGSAVAVSSEMAYASLGTDTAGSVRIPAATCGLLGLKTTHGLLPTEGVHPLAASLDGVGLLTRSAADAQQILLALHPTLHPAPGSFSVQPRLKAWLPEAQLHPDVECALSQLASEWQIKERLTQLPEHAVLTGLAEIVLHHEAAATHEKNLLACSLSSAVEAVALPGLAIPRAWYQAAIAARSQHAQAFFAAHLKDHDVLLLPALPRPVPDGDSVDADSPNFKVRELLALHQFMGFVNYLGFPSVVIPIAHDERGLPVTVQLIGRPHDELTLLSLAHTIELQRFGSSGFTRHFSHLKD
jgi:aspartyl-tRNA(Asn)/glutamyl-tRNA(Gln) amidotransferase subunit A